jgi:small subunit ribosomal protein S17
MPNKRRRLTGHVVSNKMDKTAVVQVEHTFRHPLYGKVIRSNKRYMAHDEGNECEIGDVVIIVESQPLSKHKRWVVQEIVREDLSARTTEVDDLAEVFDEVEEEEAEQPEEAGEPVEAAAAAETDTEDGE